MNQTHVPEILPIARGYIRVSTGMQVEEGVSLSTQRKRIEEYCSFKNLKLTEVYEDSGLSAKDMQHRPALQRLLIDTKKGEFLIVTDLSRLSRNTKDALTMFEDFRNRGINFVCMALNMDLSTPIGQMMLTVISAVATLERQNISAHVSHNMKMLSKEGKLRTRPPFGYRFIGKDKDLEPEPEQQKVIEKIKAMYAQSMKYAQIAKSLNDQGDNQCLDNNKKNPSDKEKLFYAETVKRILIDHSVTLRNTETIPDRTPIEQRIISHRKADNRTGHSTSAAPVPSVQGAPPAAPKLIQMPPAAQVTVAPAPAPAAAPAPAPVQPPAPETAKSPPQSQQYYNPYMYMYPPHQMMNASGQLSPSKMQQMPPMPMYMYPPPPQQGATSPSKMPMYPPYYNPYMYPPPQMGGPMPHPPQMMAPIPAPPQAKPSNS